jgi:hypothetical protein
MALDETSESLLAIGDTAGALAAAEQSRRIVADLVAADPANNDRQREFSVSENRFGPCASCTSPTRRWATCSLRETV